MKLLGSRVLLSTTLQASESRGTFTVLVSWGAMRWPPLWPSGQSSWLQIQRPGFYCRRYQIFWEVVCLERGPLSLVSTTEELLGRKSNGSGIENREYGRRNPSRWPRNTFYPQKLALTLLTRGSSWVDMVRLRTQATKFILISFKGAVRAVELGGVSRFGTPVTIWPTTPVSDDGRAWNIWRKDKCQEKSEIREETCPISLCSPQVPHDLNLGSNRGKRGGKPITIRLS
jgi:hypothetical protein